MKRWLWSRRSTTRLSRPCSIFHNTADETIPLDELVHTYYDHIGHIQIQEMDGTYLGTGDAVETYVPALQAFRDNGYDKWIIP